jgi:DNA-binding response OmpR family regulator
MELKEILIVDDEFPMLEDLQCMLQERGHSVILAFDALSALDELSGHQFDVILVSLNGHEKDKLNLLRWARRRSSQCKLIVVGYAEVTLPIDVFQIQVDDYILAPFTVMELSNRVDRCLNSDKDIMDIVEAEIDHIGNMLSSFKQKILSIHNGILSLKANFNLLIDHEANKFNNRSIDKIYNISRELNSLTDTTENILYNMLTYRNESNYNEISNIFSQVFFKQNKITQLH